MYFCAVFQRQPNMAVVAQLVRVPDCGSVGRRFESDLPPRKENSDKRLPLFFLQYYESAVTMTFLIDYLMSK